MTKVNPVTTTPVWRHTIGRLSNLTRVPINALASIGIGVKLLGKVVAIPVTYSIVGIRKLVKKDAPQYNGWFSLKGIAITGIEFAGAIRGATRCFIRTIIAPSKKDQERSDFKKGMKATWSVLKGDLQAVSTDVRTANLSASQIYERIILKKQ